MLDVEPSSKEGKVEENGVVTCVGETLPLALLCPKFVLAMALYETPVSTV